MGNYGGFLSHITKLASVLSRRSMSSRLRVGLRHAVGGISSSVRGLGFGATVTDLVALVGRVATRKRLDGSSLAVFVGLLDPFTPRVYRRV